MTRPTKRDLPGLAELARIWAVIGLQSFGGGASTQLLIRRAFVEESGWLESDEFTRFWNLCQFTPGINLLALTILIGRKLGGWRGIAAALLGLLVPSAGITCLLAAGFAETRQSTTVHAVLRGIIPATAGIMAVVGLGFARPTLRLARAEGPRALSLCALVVVAGLLALTMLSVSALVVLLGAAVAGIIFFTPGVRTGRSGSGSSRHDVAGTETSYSAQDRANLSDGAEHRSKGDLVQAETAGDSKP